MAGHLPVEEGQEVEYADKRQKMAVQSNSNSSATARRKIEDGDVGNSLANHSLFYRRINHLGFPINIPMALHIIRGHPFFRILLDVCLFWCIARHCVSRRW
jgi:hypothetical protein